MSHNTPLDNVDVFRSPSRPRHHTEQERSISPQHQEPKLVIDTNTESQSQSQSQQLSQLGHSSDAANAELLSNNTPRIKVNTKDEHTDFETPNIDRGSKDAEQYRFPLQKTDSSGPYKSLEEEIDLRLASLNNQIGRAHV